MYDCVSMAHYTVGLLIVSLLPLKLFKMTRSRKETTKSLCRFTNDIGAQLMTSRWRDNEHFLPNNDLEELIPRETIKKVLGIDDSTLQESIKVIYTLAYGRNLNRSTWKQLRSSGITDRELPITDKQSERCFGTESNAIRVRFSIDQYLFLSPTFGNSASIEASKGDISSLNSIAPETTVINASLPLPITYRSDTQYSGGFGTVYQIKMHHSHLSYHRRYLQIVNNHHILLHLMSLLVCHYRRENFFSPRMLYMVASLGL